MVEGQKQGICIVDGERTASCESTAVGVSGVSDECYSVGKRPFIESSACVVGEEANRRACVDEISDSRIPIL